MSATIYLDKIPLLKQVRELALADCIPGGTKNNYDFVKEKVAYDENISELDRLILNDAQTSGGLLICVPQEVKDELINAANSMKLTCLELIGSISKKMTKSIFVNKHF